MSKDGNYPAFPGKNFSGMTKREYIATHILAGAQAGPAEYTSDEAAAKDAVGQADALIQALSEKE